MDGRRKVDGMHERIAVVSLAVSLTCGAALAPALARSSQESGTLEIYRRGLGMVERALDELGGVSALREGLVLRGAGTYDLSSRLQGRRVGVPEPVPFVEALAVEPVSRRLAYESDAMINSDAAEHLRLRYDGDRRMLFLDLINRRGFWDTGPGLEDRRQRYANMVPHLLLAHALEHRQTLRYLGRIEIGEGSRDAVSFTRPTGEAVTLLFDGRTGRLRDVEYLLDMPLLGDTRVRWSFSPYQPTEVGLYPGGYRIALGERGLKRVEYTTIEGGAAAVTESGLFEAPADVEVLEPSEPPSGEGEDAEDGTETSLAEPRELADGVYLVPNIRSGFHPLIVELDEGVLVVDAPTGWYEMQQLPAMNWVAGETSSSVGARLLEVAAATVPGKPVRWLVLTHHHSDHAGGVRPFVDAGAAILAAPETARVVEEVVRRPFTLAPDPLTGRSVTPRIEVVRGERVVGDGDRSVRILDVGPNPHVAGMLVVFLPGDEILYVADLFEPLPERMFPSLARVPVMRWFVDWLDGSGLDPERIYSIHGAARVTDEQLEEIRSSGVSDPP